MRTVKDVFVTAVENFEHAVRAHEMKGALVNQYEKEQVEKEYEFCKRVLLEFKEIIE